MKKNWLSGVLLLITMLICSVSFAAAQPSVLAVTAFDVVSVADMQPTGLNISVGAQVKPVSVGIGAGSSDITAMATSGDYGGGPSTVPCLAGCNHKTTDNVTASIGRNFEVGWR